MPVAVISISMVYNTVTYQQNSRHKIKIEVVIKKKTLSIFLIVLMFCAVISVGCGGGSDSPDSSQTEDITDDTDDGMQPLPSATQLSSLRAVIP